MVARQQRRQHTRFPRPAGKRQSRVEAQVRFCAASPCATPPSRRRNPQSRLEPAEEPGQQRETRTGTTGAAPLPISPGQCAIRPRAKRETGLAFPDFHGLTPPRTPTRRPRAPRNTHLDLRMRATVLRGGPGFICADNSIQIGAWSLVFSPSAFQRGDLSRDNIVTCAAANASRDGRRVRTAGLVLVRKMAGQRMRDFR
jgi:hypothetical protein